MKLKLFYWNGVKWEARKLHDIFASNCSVETSKTQIQINYATTTCLVFVQQTFYW